MTPKEQLELEAYLWQLSDEELVEFQENLMEVIIEKKMASDKIVFSGVENGLLN